jgi:hypothetical protein
MSTQTLQREIDMVRANRYEISDEMQGSASVPRASRLQQHQQQQNINAGKNQQQLSQQEFLRSASARLPNKKGVSDPEEVNRLDGERKREESMKRLLEWKQRMLQSPLTRKGPQLSVASPASNTQSLHLPPKSPMTVQNNWQTMDSVTSQKGNHALQRSRSDTHAIGGYGNEDSSDDEGEFFKYFYFLSLFSLFSNHSPHSFALAFSPFFSIQRVLLNARNFQ